jgi:uncharacterized membrane protein YphA (DoxX/SURF4 family)
MLPSSRFYATWIAIVRIFTGALWLSFGLDKFVRPFMPPTGYMVAFLKTAAANSHGWYHDYLMDVVLPNAALFGQLSRYGEVIVGGLLVLGLFTRWGAIGGMLLALNYLPANYAFYAFQTPIIQLVDVHIFVLSALAAITPAGRALGVDGLFAARRFRIPLLRPRFIDRESHPDVHQRL